MYMGYWVQFLHQCHLSGSAPLTYSTILLSSQNNNYITTDISQCRLLETWLRLIMIPFLLHFTDITWNKKGSWKVMLKILLRTFAEIRKLGGLDVTSA